MTDGALLGPWIRRFLLEHLIGERNLSTNTQKSYRDMLKQLLPFIGTRLRKSVDRLTVPDLSAKLVRQFLTHLEGKRHCGISTRNQRLGGIHALAAFIGEHRPEYIAWAAEVRQVPFKKFTAPVITCLDRAEINALLAVPDRSTLQGRREHALLLFLYNSGARASEAAQLTIADLDWYARSVQILGKGSKLRTCPLWPVTIKALRPLTNGRRSDERVFLNRLSQTLTRSGIHALVKRCAARARQTQPSLATKTVGPHTIRHSTASHLLRAGVDLNTIRAWLGHVSINTTNIYAEIDLDTKALALNACIPTLTRSRDRSWRSKPALMDFLLSL
jgi:site-specific recombinase XerD